MRIRKSAVNSVSTVISENMYSFGVLVPPAPKSFVLTVFSSVTSSFGNIYVRESINKAKIDWFVPLKLASIACWYRTFHYFKTKRKLWEEEPCFGQGCAWPWLISGYCQLLYLVKCSMALKALYKGAVLYSRTRGTKRESLLLCLFHLSVLMFLNIKLVYLARIHCSVGFYVTMESRREIHWYPYTNNIPQVLFPPKNALYWWTENLTWNNFVNENVLSVSKDSAG